MEAKRGERSAQAWEAGARRRMCTAGPLRALTLAVAYAAGAVTSACRDTTGLGTANAIVLENGILGTTVWRDSGLGFASPDSLSLWVSPYAVTTGATVDVYVRALSAPVALSVYRMGWYRGLGGRPMGRWDSLPADPQSPCGAALDAPVVCPWHRSLALATGADWLPGLYLLRAVDGAGKVSVSAFVVRGQRPARLALVIPQLTWQAYNDFGGASLYTPDPTTPSGLGRFVSFERPFSQRSLQYDLNQILPSVRWFEQKGYDVTYVSDADLERAADVRALGVRALIFPAHDEYWTRAMRDTVEAFRDGGGHLVFLSANNAYWNVRLSPGQVTGRARHQMTCWKSALDPDAATPSEVTTRFRDPPVDRPENALVGVMFVGMGPSAKRALYVSDSAVGREAAAFLAAAGLASGDSLPALAADEGDEIVANGSTPPGLQVLFRAPWSRRPGQLDVFYTTFYVAGSGAGVFAAGNRPFAFGLDPWGGPAYSQPLQRVIVAVLDWMASH